MKKSYAALLALALGGAAHASDMETIFGLPIGKPVALQHCEVNFGIVRNRPCIEKRASPSAFTFVHIPYAETPPILKKSEFLVRELDGELSAVHFTTAGILNQDRDLQDLKAKFGQPSTITMREVKNKLGATLETFLATWQTSTLMITYDPAPHTLDEGVVRIETPKARELRERTIRDQKSQERQL